MNVEQLCEFYRRTGYSVIAGPSGYWYGTNHLVHINAPSFQSINPPLAEVETLLLKHRLAVARYSSSGDQQGKVGYLYVCEDKSYDPVKLSKRARRQIRKGLANCSVREIDFDYLHAHGMPLNLDSTRRHERDNPLYTQPERWAQFCDAGRCVEGARVWGALVEGQLAAYVVGFIVGDWADLLVMASRTDMWPLYPNHALIYSVTRELLSESGINHVGMGHSSLLDKPGIDLFKNRMGFVPHEVNFAAVVHPWLRPVLLSRLGQSMLMAMRRRAPEREILHRVAAVLEIARAFRGQIQLDSVSDPAAQPGTDRGQTADLDARF